MHPLSSASGRSLLFFLDHPDSFPGHLDSYNPSSVKNICVTTVLKFHRQIGRVVERSFYPLRLVAEVKPYFPPRDSEKQSRALNSSWRNYFICLLVGISQLSLCRLYFVQNVF